MIYPLLRRALFTLDPETAHRLVMTLMHFSHEHPGALRLLSWTFGGADDRLGVDLFGHRFANPFGLAAGFDKDGEAAAAWSALGFGHAELGTVTAIPQPGNPKPRLFRLPESRAIINRMGFNNHGAAALSARLASDRGLPYWPAAPVVVNVGKSRAVEVEEAIPDYRAALTMVWQVADLIELNVSSPNTPGLRSLQAAEPLRALLGLTEELRLELGPKPVLLKIAPDLSEPELDALVAAAETHHIDGLVATNTTIRRDLLPRDPQQAGGLSGEPLGPLALQILRQLRARTRLPLVAVGGVMNATDAIARFEAGASLVQLYSGWIYSGPAMLRSLKRGVRSWLDAQGVPTLQAYLERRDA
jgi:dihydroorotate dehydrogenase